MKVMTCSDCNAEYEVTDEEATAGNCLICGGTNVTVEVVNAHTQTEVR